MFTPLVAWQYEVSFKNPIDRVRGFLILVLAICPFYKEPKIYKAMSLLENKMWELE